MRRKAGREVGKSHQFLAVARSTTDPCWWDGLAAWKGTEWLVLVWCGRSDVWEGMAGMNGRYVGMVYFCPLDHRPLLMRQLGTSDSREDMSDVVWYIEMVRYVTIWFDMVCFGVFWWWVYNGMVNALTDETGISVLVWWWLVRSVREVLPNFSKLSKLLKFINLCGNTILTQFYSTVPKLQMGTGMKSTLTCW